MHILLVEDEITLAMGVEYSLKNEKFEVTRASSLKEAREKVKTCSADLLLLDVNLGDGTGYDLCKELREAGNDVPIIFLTACDEEANVVLGLDLGADDYLNKPIRVKELIARINVIFRRRGMTKDTNSSEKINCGDLIIYPLKYEVVKNEVKIQLTSVEYKLLLLLIENKGNVLSIKKLLEKIWDVDGNFVDERTLTVYIKRLREKLEEDKENPYIETIRGVGYKWIR